jgi:hypothetical protein
MTHLDGIAAIGIRHLVCAARALRRDSGRLVLLGPNALVTNMLIRARVDDLLPIMWSENDAREALGVTKDTHHQKSSASSGFSHDDGANSPTQVESFSEVGAPASEPSNSEICITHSPRSGTIPAAPANQAALGALGRSADRRQHVVRSRHGDSTPSQPV